ncbi:MAG: VCBS repeat-containing protein, partial [Opitutaceae bacterium]
GRALPIACGIFAATALALLLAGCGDRSAPTRAPAAAAVAEELTRLTPEPIGRIDTGHHPWVSNLIAVDLDRDGREDVVACEAQDHEVIWLKQNAGGRFEEIVLAKNMRGPVHTSAVDLDGDGDLDLLVACMAELFPNNDRIGTIFALENDGRQTFTPHILLERVARVTDVQAADLNGDGKLDLAVVQFGYDQGEVRWMERTGPWEFRSHNLLNLSGGVNIRIADFTGDGTLDIVTNLSQQWEEVYLFDNDGRGNFKTRTLFGSTNDDFASSNLTSGDLDGDGRPDIVFANGDGFGPTSQPGPRPWHGVQWLQNGGGGAFKFHRLGTLAGAYSPVILDLDQDGHNDIVAVSAFNNWSDPRAVAMMWFRNDGKLNFTPIVLAHEPTHLLSIVAVRVEGSPKPALMSGAFHAYPPYNRLSRFLLWKQK